MTKAQIKAKPELKVIKEEEIPHLLVPGEMGAVLELTVKDKDGKVTDRRVMRSRSFTRQFLELLWIQAYQISEIAPYNMRDTSNILQDICESCFTFGCKALADDDTWGIVVGTGTTAADIDDYHIETLIAHGVGTLQYGEVTFGAPASDTNTSQFTITRNFANGSGGDITVNEIGLYVKGYEYNSTYYFMTIRDVIGGGILVPDGETLTVNYREQVVV